MRLTSSIKIKESLVANPVAKNRESAQSGIRELMHHTEDHRSRCHLLRESGEGSLDRIIVRQPGENGILDLDARKVCWDTVRSGNHSLIKPMRVNRSER